MGCCQITFLVLLCLLVGLLAGIFFAEQYGIHGVEDLWRRVVDQFRKTSSKAQQSLNIE